VLVESTSNQVNQEGGYTGVTPAGFVEFVARLRAESGLQAGRVVLGGDHLGPHPWAALGARTAMERAARMVRDYVGAGYEKIHLDASMRCADDPPGALADEVIADRTAALAAEAEAAVSDRAGAGPAPVYVIGTEVPPPGGQAGEHAGPVPTRVEDARRGLELTRAAFALRGLERAWERVLAQVVQPGVEFGDDVVYRYRREPAAHLRAFSESQERLVFEAHSTDYQTEASLRALVEDHFAVLKVGPELTFALREALFALEAIERELLERRAPERLSGLRRALESSMREDPRHWKAYYGEADEETLRLRRAFSLSDRARYYWPVPAVRQAAERLFANLDAERLPAGLLRQHLPQEAEPLASGPREGATARLARGAVRRVLARYARACGARGRAVAPREGLPL
jgi:D-tagatose-1,6-bisphosphate aldolase subunit GatZ/KbaZ